MFCDECGTELPDDAGFCSNCGKRVKVKEKNIYVALILTFILTGVGSIYAGNLKKGLALLAARLAFAVLGILSGIFFFFSIVIWVYGFYEAYRDVQTANGRSNPKLLEDFKGWNSNTQIIAALIVMIILIFALFGTASLFVGDSYSPSDAGSSYHTSHSSSGSSSSSHYGGVDNSPRTIAKNDPDWYYDHYDYGDNDKIDEYLESQGYD